LLAFGSPGIAERAPLGKTGFIAKEEYLPKPGQIVVDRIL
jgi:hypothetical protein